MAKTVEETTPHGNAAAAGRRDTPYRAAVWTAIVGAFLLAWLSLGVGIIGADGDPANLMYFGVIAAGFVGAFVARFEPRGMARALYAVATLQALVGAFAVVAGLGRPWSGALELIVLNGFFAALFAASGWLFQRAAGPPAAGPQE